MAGLQTGDVPSRPEQPRPEPGQILIVIRKFADGGVLAPLFGMLDMAHPLLGVERNLRTILMEGL